MRDEGGGGVHNGQKSVRYFMDSPIGEEQDTHTTSWMKQFAITDIFMQRMQILNHSQQRRSINTLKSTVFHTELYVLSLCKDERKIHVHILLYLHKNCGMQIKDTE